MQAEDPPVVVEEDYHVPVERVWSAITDVEQMRQWYFEVIPSFEPRVGFETRFEIQNEDRHFLHVWTVTEVVPLERLQYDWKYEGFQGDSLATFELSTQDGATRLKLTHEVRESFPDDVPEFRRESCVAGWNFFLKDRLKNFLEG